jgi:hypothetical protein
VASFGCRLAIVSHAIQSADSGPHRLSFHSLALSDDPQKGTGTGVHGRSQSPFASGFVVRCKCDPEPDGAGGGEGVYGRTAFMSRLGRPGLDRFLRRILAAFPTGMIVPMG